MDHTAQLNESRRELLAHMHNLSEGLRVESVPELMENLMLVQIRDEAAKEIWDSQRRLCRVDAALERVRMGDYGECAECGGSIGENRLTAIPWAETCISCAVKAPEGLHLVKAR